MAVPLSIDTEMVPETLTVKGALPALPPLPIVSPPNSPLKRRADYEYLEVPILTPEELAEGEMKKEVLAERVEDGKLYYYVLLKGGHVDKFTPDVMAEGDSDLLKAYERKKRTKQLKPFNFSKDRRLKPYARAIEDGNALKVKIDRKKILRPIKAVASESYSEDSSALTELTSDDQQSSYEGSEDEEDEPRGPRRSKRAINKEEDEPRRSTRLAVVGAARKIGAQVPGPSPRKTTRPNTRSQAALENGSDEDTYAKPEMAAKQPAARGKAAAPKAKKAVAPKPPPNLELGGVFPVEDCPVESEIALSDPLRVHRTHCEKCRQEAAHLMPPKKGSQKNKAKKERGQYDEDSENSADEKDADELGGWLKCVRCCVVGHWTCVSASQRQDVVAAVRAKMGEGSKWNRLANGEIGAFVCGACTRRAACIGCKELVPHVEAASVVGPPKPDATATELAAPLQAVKLVDADGDVVMEPPAEVPKEDDQPNPFVVPAAPQPLLFRCTRCRRGAHYECLPNPPDSYDVENPALPLDDLALHYQETWQCADCSRWVYALEHILAWRPAVGVTEEAMNEGSANYKSHLPREYLVKWERRSYARCEWVPHAWLVTVNAAKVKNFLDGGRKVELLAGGIETEDGGVKSGVVIYEGSNYGPPQAEKDAERRIPEAWKRVHRVLDVMFWIPSGADKRRPPKKGKKRAKARPARRLVQSESESDEEEEEEDEEEDQPSDNEMASRRLIMRAGTQPNKKVLESADQRIQRTAKHLKESDAKDIAWCFIKWEDLGYEQSTWDSPMSPDGTPYEGMVKAFKSFALAGRINIPKVSKARAQTLDRDRRRGQAPTMSMEQPDLGQDPKLRLYEFQLLGVYWLCRQWWEKRSAILADEMGLGKTVQVITFLGYLFDTMEDFAPILVVVPNSTITNWLREFALWAPRMHVVPYLGEAESRRIIREFELFPPSKQTSKTAIGLKAHVVVTTYEAITNAKDHSSVFKSIPRWEVLVVDESQRLKNDASLIFKRLSELNTVHRVLMTGTPLNNNLRELFNLMNFLDPETWDNVVELEKEFENLTEESIVDLHNRLKPYFLRRTKEDVLDLPPKNEVIVPVSMSTLQKEVYKSVLSKNANLIGSLAKSLTSKIRIKKGSLTNILMDLRKCLGHPYLVSNALEPPNLPPDELHKVFLEASAKLQLLKVMLPKLKARGHRVLLFSQFKIVLNCVEDFLTGEGYKDEYLRLDGDTKQSERQKGIDQFNRDGSNLFIFLLSTRAGGVGINLTSADTVIMFDPDFNPHMDLQAIARAHRIGQKKPVLVFKLMTKGSAEEKIVEAGKKKLVLDHLIVQTMQEDDPGEDDYQSILTFGAKALFEENGGASHDIVYSEADIEKLIIKTEIEGDATSKEESTKKKGMTFDFAKIWEVEKPAVEQESEDAGNGAEALQDFWAEVAARAQAEQEEKESKVKLGRGARRAAAAAVYSYVQATPNGSPEKEAKEAGSDEPSDEASDHDQEFVLRSDSGSDQDDDDEANVLAVLQPDEIEATMAPKKSRKIRGLAARDIVSAELPRPAWDESAFSRDAGSVAMDAASPVVQPSFQLGQPIRRPLVPRRLNGSAHLGGDMPSDDFSAQSNRDVDATGSFVPMKLATSVDRRSLKRSRTPEEEYEWEREDCRLCGSQHPPSKCPVLENEAGLLRTREEIMASDEAQEWKVPALTVVNDKLAKIFQAKKSIASQAFRPIKKRKSGDGDDGQNEYYPVFDQRRKSASVPRQGITEGSTSQATKPVSSGKPIKRKSVAAAVPPSQPAVGSESSVVDGSAAGACPICHYVEAHAPKSCPKLRKGPLAIKRAIEACSQAGLSEAYIDALRSLLRSRHNLEVDRSKYAAPVLPNPAPSTPTIAGPSTLRDRILPRKSLPPIRPPLCIICSKGHHVPFSCPTVPTMDVSPLKTSMTKLKKIQTRTPEDAVAVNEAIKVLRTRRKDLHVAELAAKKELGAEINPIEISD